MLPCIIWEGHAEFFRRRRPLYIIVLLSPCTQAIMVCEMLSDITVARWMQCVTNDMLRNNRTDIRCPCRRCKLECVTEPDSGILEKHLKRNGLMDGYTWWIRDEIG